MSSIDLAPIVKPDPSTFKYQGRGRSYHHKKQPTGAASHIIRNIFKGDTADLEGNVYDVGLSNQAEIFTITTKKIVSNAGRTYTESQDIRIALESIKEITISRPVKEKSNDDAMETLILTCEIDAYIKRLNAYSQNKASM